MRGIHGTPVTYQTQTRFEELYYELIESFTEHALSRKIAQILNRTTHAILMRFRQTFHGGSERIKAELVSAMEELQKEQK